jgi:hypothetical protein
MSCRIAGPLIGAALAACSWLPLPAAAPPPSAPPQSAAVHRPAPAVSKPSARFIGFVGPALQHDPPFLGVPYSNFYCLRSFLDRQTGETAHQLYVADSYFGGERGWNGAQDAAGDALPFTHVDTDKITCENGCAYEEEFAATLSEAALRANARDFTVTFTSRSGASMTIELSAALIASQLAAVDAARDRLPAQAAAPAGAPQ